MTATLNTTQWRARAEQCRQMASVNIFTDIALRWRVVAALWDDYANRADAAIADKAAATRSHKEWLKKNAA